MTAVDYTSTILYHYLRALSVRVSRATVRRLLDTPVAGSMRSLSDALDALRVKNEVYQLPPSPDYFGQLEAPFVTMLRQESDPYCVVTGRDDTAVTFIDGRGARQHRMTDRFVQQWTGCVLLGATTSDTPSEACCRWKDIGYFLSEYKAVFAIFLIIILGIAGAGQHPGLPTFIAYLWSLAFGILVSVAILYKEQFNEHFLEHFCRIGKAVDCNRVLHSRGASIAGIGLGELSLLYFATLFLFCTLFSQACYGIAVLCNATALCFTLYSVVYQVSVVRKGCMLCMLVNIAVWINTAELYLLKRELSLHTPLYALLAFALIGCVCLTAETIFGHYQAEYKKKNLLAERLSGLLNPDAFRQLLALEPQIKEDIPATDIAINNPLPGSQRVLVVTNPNCRNCARNHPYIKELSASIPVSILLISNDKLGREACEVILTAYLQEGWDKAMLLLEEWFETQTIKEMDKYLTTDAAKGMMKEQVMYCWRQNINRTPSVIVDGRYVPDVYSLSYLRYVLT